MRRLGPLLGAALLAAGCGPNTRGTESPEGSRRGLQFKADAAPANVDVAGVYDKSHAVVIGIDKYAHVPQLGGATRDAKEFARALEAHGFEVTLLLDEAATRAAIAEELGDRLHARVGPNDRVIVFFAGHGFSTGDGDTRMGYLLPIEGKRDAVRATSLSMSELQNWLAGYSAKHVMFVADACYSGLALSTRSTGLDPGTMSYLQEITSKRVRFTLVAGRDDQEAHEDTQSGHGVFTRFVLEGLSGAADVNHDGLVTSDELSVYVKPQVTAYVAQNFNSSQTPQSARSGMGELVFFTAAKAGSPPLASAPPPKPVATPPAATPTVAMAGPVAAPPPKSEPAPAVADTGIEGVTRNGNVVTITTTAAPRFLDNTTGALGDLRDKQMAKLRKVLAGPPFNMSREQIEARAEALYKAHRDDKSRATFGQTDAGDRTLTIEYHVR